MDDYEEYEAHCARIRESNEKLLDQFANWLKRSGLASRTIENHVQNIDFYINEFLLYDDVMEPQEGACEGVHERSVGELRDL